MQRSLFLFFFLIPFISKSQHEVLFFVDGSLEEKKVIKDTLGINDYAQSQVQEFIKNGFYFAGQDSSIEKGDQLKIYLHRGEKLESEFANFRGPDIVKTITKRLAYLGENGYPFARLYLDSLQVDSGQLSGKLIEKKGPLVNNDSCFFFQNIKTNHDFIYQLLDHVPGEVFKESSYQEIDQKIQRSSFLTLGRPADISFQNKKAKLYLDIQESETSSFQGILGLQQTALGKSELVGSFDLAVENLFRSGKLFEMNWERFRENSQQLSISYDHPFVFRSKISPSFNFDLLKQDSTFLQRDTGLGFSTYISPRVELNLKYLKRVGVLLTTDSQLLTNADLADFGTDLYQLKLQRGKVTDFAKLSSEFAWETVIGLGTKVIEKNLSLSDSFYDTLALSTNIFQFDFRSMLNFQISKRLVANQQFRVGVIENDELLNNERYRLGGLATLRGFDEKSIFADGYFISRTELRSFFEKGSFLFLFFDQLLYKNENFSDAPFGSGFGFSLATLSGQFSFALAVGKSKAQEINLTRMKAHFGYITRF